MMMMTGEAGRQQNTSMLIIWDYEQQLILDSLRGRDIWR
jgi:hypothetical protein